MGLFGRLNDHTDGDIVARWGRDGLGLSHVGHEWKVRSHDMFGAELGISVFGCWGASKIKLRMKNETPRLRDQADPFYRLEGQGESEQA